MRCHPMRWLWGLIPIAMLAWLAVQTEHSHIERDLERRSSEALRAAGHDWAVVAFDGRDGLLAGQPRDGVQLAAAADLVRNVWGVRVVRTRSVAPAIRDIPFTPATDGGAPDGLLPDSEPLPLGDSVPVADADISAGHHKVITGTSPEEGAHQSELTLGHAREVDGGPQVTVPTLEVASAPHAGEAITAAAEAVTAASPESKTIEGDTKADAVTAAEALPDPAVATPSSAQHSTADVVAHSEPVPAGQHSRAPTVDQPETTSAPESGPAPKEGVALPERKLVEVAAATSPAEAPPLPEAKGADGAGSEETAPPVPEHKPAVEAKAENSAPGDQGPAAVSSWLSEAAAPAQAKRSRFDTAALPPSNIVEPGPCVEGVKEAARRAEVHFARGDTQIDPSGKGVLDGLVGALNICPEATLHIAGHADSTGKSRHNKVLSRHRARGVASYLIHKGIDDGRLVAVGYGDQKPVAPNDSKVNRAKNRRIELTVVARAAPLPPMPVRKQGTRNGLSAR